MILTVILTILVLMAILAGVCQYCYDRGGETYTNAITGIMFGALKNEEVQPLFDNESQEIVGQQIEHTLQLCLFFVSFTFVWAEKLN